MTDTISVFQSRTAAVTFYADDAGTQVLPPPGPIVWSCDPADAVAFSNQTGSSVTVTGQTAENATLSAASGGVTGTLPIQVTPGVVIKAIVQFTS